MKFLFMIKFIFCRAQNTMLIKSMSWIYFHCYDNNFQCCQYCSDKGTWMTMHNKINIWLHRWCILMRFTIAKSDLVFWWLKKYSILFQYYLAILLYWRKSWTCAQIYKKSYIACIKKLIRIKFNINIDSLYRGKVAQIFLYSLLWRSV